MSKLPDIAVIIPIFEEQDSIQRVLSDLEISVGTAGKIYLVADNQNDGTILVVKDFMSESSLSIQILDQSPNFGHILSRVAGVVSRFVLRSGTSDPTNLFKGVTRDFISTIQIESKSGFTIGLELVAKAQVHQFNAVSEIPTAWHERTAGKSSFRIYKWLPNYLFWYYMLINYRILSVLKFSGKRGN